MLWDSVTSSQSSQHLSKEKKKKGITDPGRMGGWRVTSNTTVAGFAN